MKKPKDVTEQKAEQSVKKKKVDITKLVKEKQLLETMSLSRTTVHRMKESGLPHYKVGRSTRFLEDEVRVWIENVWNIDFLKKVAPDKMTNDELLQKLDISRTALHRLRKQGLPFVKINNRVAYDLEEVEEWLGQQRIGQDIIHH